MHLPTWPCARRHYEALRSFHAAITTGPADPLAHFRTGNAFFALRKFPEARKGGVGGSLEGNRGYLFGGRWGGDHGRSPVLG